MPGSGFATSFARTVLRGAAVSGVLILALISFGAVAPRRAAAYPAGTPAASSQYCSSQPGYILVDFQWAPSGGGPQWLDLSLFDNGFAPDTFVSVGPLGADVAQLPWDGLLPGKTHYLRVNTLGPYGWEPSPTLAFVTGVCGVAPPPPPPPPIPAPAGQVTVQQTCSVANPGWVSVALTWVSRTEGPEWVDLSLLNNDFAAGSFVGLGPLDQRASSFTWDGLVPGRNHFLRVNTLTPGGWVASGTASFTTGFCPAGASDPIPPPRVTLTFDDYGYMGSILDVLGRYGARAMFFPIGAWAASNPGLIQRAVNEGHLVCNHTYSHARLTALSEDGVRSEIAGGSYPNCNLLRPPYAARNAFVDSIAGQLGFGIFLWNVDSRDYTYRYPGGDKDLANSVISQAFPGAVVIMHMHVANTVSALPVIIERLQSAGYVISY